jgi:hypothetical protein
MQLRMDDLDGKIALTWGATVNSRLPSAPYEMVPNAVMAASSSGRTYAIDLALDRAASGQYTGKCRGNVLWYFRSRVE